MGRRKKSKYLFEEPLKNIPKKRGKTYLKDHVFDSDHFNKHVEQVSINLKIDKEIVRDVLEQYFTAVFFAINSVRKIKTKINLYGFLSLIVHKGRRF